MRYDKELYFIKEEEGTYNGQTGDYDESVRIKSEPYWVNVTGMSINRMNAVFGRVQQGAFTIRMRERYVGKFDYIEMNGTYYEVSVEKVIRRGTIYEVGERA